MKTKSDVTTPPKPLPRLTMADLADLAGVSKITVSRALRDDTVVRPETRRRVREIAEAHGYRFNVSARNLRLQKHHTIAVIVEMTPSSERPMTESYPLGLLGGISQELTSQGWNVLLATAQSLDPTALGADGVILLGQGVHEDAVATFSQSGTPLVVWGAAQPGGRYVTVGSDNRGGGRSAAARLRAVGRRRLAFLGDIEHAELEDRWTGFQEGLRGSDAQVVARIPCGFSFAAGHAAVSAALDAAGGRLDGVFACSDLIAMGAVRALSERGLDVPHHVSVVGFDDTSMASYFVPPLTTVRQDWAAAGRLLATKILSLIQGEAAVSEELPTQLIVRGT